MLNVREAMDKPKPEPRSSVANIVGKYDKGLEDLLKQLSHIDLTDDVHDQDAYLDAHGGYCDVFIAKSRRHGERVVAIKRLRVHILHHKDVAKMLFRELTIWSSLDHPNVLPLLGYVMHGKYPALISEWMGNGTMKRYMEDHPEVSVMNMAKGIAAGLLHLHELNVVHSDLKSDNILISEDGQPLLADFGISRIMTASLSVTTTTAAPKGSVRWMAIELLEVDLSGEQSFGKPAVHTKMTDVWSYGMVIYELLTSRYPYAHLRHELQVSMAIINGQTPERPTTLKNREDDLLWLVCQKCWQADPLHRPDMGRLCNVLRHETAIYKQYEGVSADSRSLMERLQHFTLWDNPHREVFWEEPIPQSPGGWRIVLSDITLRCLVVGRRAAKNVYQVIEVESVGPLPSAADSDAPRELVYTPTAVFDLVPQYPYYPRTERKQVEFKDPISFEVVTPRGLLVLGIPVQDCLSNAGDLGHLYEGEKPVSRWQEDELPDKFYICIGWPGYKPWRQEFAHLPNRDYKEHNPAPGSPAIVVKRTIAKLAAKAVERFIEQRKDLIPDLQGDDFRWRVGPGRIEAKDLVLCGLSDRSENHWQASLRLNKPIF